MKKIKLFEEYRYFKIDPSKDNIKDPNEPFFILSKWWYKKTYEEAKEDLEETYDDMREKYRKIFYLQNTTSIIDFIESLNTTTKRIIEAVIKCIDEEKEDTESDYLNRIFERLYGHSNEIMEIEASASIIDKLLEYRYKIHSIYRDRLFTYVKNEYFED